jgi:hypothetical protein
MDITIQAIECKSNSDALQEADAGGRGEAALVDGRPMVVPQIELDRLAAAGVGFAYLHNRPLPDGSYRIVTVPVN